MMTENLDKDEWSHIFVRNVRVGNELLSYFDQLRKLFINFIFAEFFCVVHEVICILL